MRMSTAVAVAVLAAVVTGVCGRWSWMQYERALVFRARAERAEMFNKNQQVEIGLLTDRAESLERAAQRIDTVVVRAAARIAAEPTSLAARDEMIGALKIKTDTLTAANLTLHEAFVHAIAARDTLAAALGARPKTFTRFLPSNIGVGAFIGWCGERPCVGVGITVNLGSIRI